MIPMPPPHDETNKKEIEASSAEVSTVVRSFCHEVNQALQAIAGYAELFSMQLPKEDPRVPWIQGIQAQSDRMVEAVQQLRARLVQEATSEKIGEEKRKI